jgi:4-hydroxythreonine-4-phosphate dehydrogenase
LGDPNGIGLELAIKNHNTIKEWCEPIYCVSEELLKSAAKFLEYEFPKDMKIFGTYKRCIIKPAQVDKEAGEFSYNSFLTAIDLAKENKVSGVCTLPIHKKAWELAGVNYVGHTDMLRDIFKKNAIMMLGCEKMFVALFTEHIPLKDVVSKIKLNDLKRFFLDFYRSEIKDTNEKVAVLGLNPHAGDDGVLGDEEIIIKEAINEINNQLNNNIFEGPMVPDTIFTPNARKSYKYFIAMYHDQGLAPLKALYFEEGINVSLNLPIQRSSVDHGTAFDIAYKHNRVLNAKSYLNAIKKLLD